MVTGGYVIAQQPLGGCSPARWRQVGRRPRPARGKMHGSWEQHPRRGPRGARAGSARHCIPAALLRAAYWRARVAVSWSLSAVRGRL